jgi:hypothetical protein
MTNDEAGMTKVQELGGGTSKGCRWSGRIEDEDEDEDDF